MTYYEFSKKFHIYLNPSQQSAVQAIDGPVLLLAVPGSGKTTVLISRIGYMIYACDIPAKQILAMTFTKAATRDMEQRFENVFGEKKLSFYTIHSVSLHIIRMYERLTGRSAFTLMSDEKQLSDLLAQLYREIVHDFATESDLKGLRAFITYVKNMRLTEGEIKELDTDGLPFPQIYDAYCREMKKRGWMDYDDLLTYALKILQKHSVILENLQEQYRYILVDEAQDTSKIQHEIISLLAQKYKNLFMVGDEDQSIYGFRAAYPEALLSFEKNYPGAKILLMEQNYRSSSHIVNAADRLIRNNQLRHKKKMIATRPEGASIHFIDTTRQKQIAYLQTVARNCTTETAVLYRDNESVIPLVDALDRLHLPFKLRQGDYTFFTHRLVRDVVDVITLALNPRDTEAFLRVFFKISCFLTRQQAERACALSEQLDIPILDAAIEYLDLAPSVRGRCMANRTNLERMHCETVSKAIWRIENTMAYGEYLERNHMKRGKLDILHSLADRCSDLREFLQRLDELRELIGNKDNSVEAPLILSTIHSSKGLEYDEVYLMDACDGIFPETVADALSTEREMADFEEERRLFYVAVTRAKNVLHIFRFDGGCTFTKELLDLPITKKEEKGIQVNFRQREKMGQFLDTFHEGSLIRHKLFGLGVITSIGGEMVTIHFKKGPTRQFLLETLAEQELLTLEILDRLKKKKH